MYKQVVVMRSDLKMSRGKMAVQSAHAAVGAMQCAKKPLVAAWGKQGQKKIIVSEKSEDSLIALVTKCKKLGIAHFLVADAGLTELAPGTITAVGIGPDKEEKINKVTGSLPLLK